MMNEVAVQRSGLSGNVEVRMNFALSPPAFVAPEKAELVIRPDSAMLHPLPQKMIPPGDSVGIDVSRRGADNADDFFLQPWREFLVAVDLQHPFMSALRYRPIFLRG